MADSVEPPNVGAVPSARARAAGSQGSVGQSPASGHSAACGTGREGALWAECGFVSDHWFSWQAKEAIKNEGLLHSRRVPIKQRLRAGALESWL